MVCQICGKILWNQNDYDEYKYHSETFKAYFPDIRVGYCENCMLYQIGIEDTEDNQKKLIAYYENDYRKTDEKPNVLDKNYPLYARGEGISKIIEKHLKSCKKCFEKGAGYGFNLMAMRRLYPDAELFTDEMDLHTVEYLSGIEKRSLDFEDYYDVIIMSHVFEHLLNCNATMRLCAARLKKDGLLYLEVPNSLHFNEPHITFWTKKSLLRYLKMYFSDCFELIACKTTGFPSYFKNKLSLLVAKLFRKLILLFSSNKDLINISFANGTYLRVLLRRR